MTTRTPTTRQPTRILSALMQAALGSAALYQPSGGAARGFNDGVAMLATMADVRFLLDGHLQAWTGWAGLDDGAARRLGRLLRHRRADLASGSAVTAVVRRLLLSDAIPGCRPIDGDHETVHLAPGMPLETFVDSALDELDAVRALNTRPRTTASPGLHTAVVGLRGDRTRPSRSTELSLMIPDHDPAAQPEPPNVATAEPAPQLQPTHHELVDIAARLDASLPGKPYRAHRLRIMLSRLRTAAGPADRFEMLAGPTQVLNAPTGTGKNILVEALACWAVAHGHTMTVVLSRNVEVLRAVRALEQALPLFRDGARATPLMSPTAIARTMDEVMRTRPDWDPDGMWTAERLGYGCAVAAASSSDADVDDWRPGAEPCAGLRPASGDGARGTVACPWRSSCGKFRLSRAAATAEVIVTTHGNMHTGRMHAPLRHAGTVTDRMSVEELVMLRSQLIVVDEIDSFQSGALDQAARGVVLAASGSSATPLGALDEEFRRATGRVDPEVDSRVRSGLARSRYLAETYVSHLSYGRLEPTRRAVVPGTAARSWHVPRRWDGWLAAKLAGIAEDAELTGDMVQQLRSLFPGEADIAPTEPAVFATVRRTLRDVAEIPDTDTAQFSDLRIELDHVLGSTVPEQGERDLVIDRLLRRAILERLRLFLTRMVTDTPQLAAAGVDAVRPFSEELGPYARWRVTPNGPMGRLVFAFSEYVDEGAAGDVWLRAVGFGDDPHVGVLALGDTTALCHAGTRRVVLGLSATAYFPLAPRHHVHVAPTWWMPDQSGDVSVHAVEIPTTATSSIRSGRGQLVRVSGQQGRDRQEALRQIGYGVAPRLISELDQLGTDAPERARVLLATTSYESCSLLADGLVQGGMTAERIVVITRAEVNARGAADPRDLPTGPQVDLSGGARRIRHLPADRVEEFSALAGADVLIAPLARVQRGVNILGESDRSALGSIWLMVRPVPVMEEPEELVAHVNAKSLRENPAGDDPVAVLDGRRHTAGRHFEDIVTSAPYLRSMPLEVRVAVAAQILNGAVQLLGRARRGGTPATLHLVDGAFHDTSTGNDFARLLHALRERWRRAGDLPLVEELYGTTLQAFFDYADRARPTTRNPRTD